MNDNRWHEMTASEISSKFQALEAERDYYKKIAESVKDTSIKESVDFVVDTMNSGEVDPKAVYPRGNRYHGD